MSLSSSAAREETGPLPRRVLGRSGLSVSRLGLAGSFGIDADGVERAFHELGINYFFVLPKMTGLAEGVRRLCRAGYRDRIVIASGASIPFGWSVTREWERVCRGLEMEYIDVFHLFWVQAHFYVTGKTWPAMRKLKESGKARALAISCHDRPMARSLVDELGLDALMIRYNAAHLGAEGEIFSSLPAEPEARPGIIAYTATRWGMLLKPQGDLPAMSAPECYRFALMHPAVDVVLCGAQSYDELAENAAGVRAGALSPERVAEIKKFGDLVRSTARGKLGFSGV